MKKSLWILGLALIVGGIFLAVKKKQNGVAGKKTLHLYIYANYIEPSVLQQFKDEFGVDVVEENCSSNEEVEGKLKAGASGYDLITPSDYMIQRLAASGLISPIDRSKIPNVKHLDPTFEKPSYDPEGKWAVPYMWGSTGIGYNKKFVTEAPKSWAQLFDPAYLDKWQKRVSILDDPREVIGAALKVNGKSINDTSADALSAAKAKMLGMLPHIGRIDSTSYKDLLASGDLWIVHGYSGDVLKMKANNPDIEYIIPDEGGSIWADNLAIPSASSNKELAHQFIDFIMRPEINAKIAAYIHYATTNATAKALVPKDQLENPNIYPSPEQQKKLEWFADLGDKSDTVDTLWNEVRTSAGAPTASSEEEEAAPKDTTGAG